MAAIAAHGLLFPSGCVLRRDAIAKITYSGRAFSEQGDIMFGQQAVYLEMTDAKAIGDARASLEAAREFRPVAYKARETGTLSVEYRDGSVAHMTLLGKDWIRDSDGRLFETQEAHHVLLSGPGWK
jgi:hypothetical protein